MIEGTIAKRDPVKLPQSNPLQCFTFGLTFETLPFKITLVHVSIAVNPPKENDGTQLERKRDHHRRLLSGTCAWEKCDQSIRTGRNQTCFHFLLLLSRAIIEIRVTGQDLLGDAQRCDINRLHYSAHNNAVML